MPAERGGFDRDAMRVFLNESCGGHGIGDPTPRPRHECWRCLERCMEKALAAGRATGIEEAALCVQRDAENFEHAVHEGPALERAASKILAAHMRDLLDEIRALLRGKE